MLIFGKQITDECSKCGQVLECELFRQGHGIKCDRQNISKMLECQFEHREKRENDGISRNTQNWQKGRLVMYWLKRKDFCIFKNEIVIIPTIRIFIDNMVYKEKNFSIEFHFLIIHARLLFYKTRIQVTYSNGYVGSTPAVTVVMFLAFWTGRTHYLPFLPRQVHQLGLLLRAVRDHPTGIGRVKFHNT